MTEGGQTIPVGWNWMNSMLIRAAPARSARAWPSPVYSQELLVTLKDLPMPPVARITVGASEQHESAGLPPVGERAGDRCRSAMPPAAVEQQLGRR